MSANIRPAGVFDSDYSDDIALNRTRSDRILSNGAFIALLIIPLLTAVGPLGIDFLPSLWVGTINRLAILVIAVQGLNILTGYTGQISLGHAAFIAVGGYSAALLMRELGMPFWFALPLSALFSGFIGLLFGLPSLRVKGFYLAMATLAAQFIIPWIIEHPLAHLTNGTNPLLVPAPIIGPFLTYFEDGVEGICGETTTFPMEAGDRVLVDVVTIEIPALCGAPPVFGVLDPNGDDLPPGELLASANESDIFRLEFTASKPGTYQVMVTPDEEAEAVEGTYSIQVGMRKALSFASAGMMYYVIVPLSVFMMLAARNIIRTRVGRAFVSVRDNDLAAELLGINVFAYKLQAFFISAIFAGVAGALIAAETNTLSIDRFRLDFSIEMLAMLIIGGAGFPLAALFGAAFVNLLNEIVIPTISPFLRDVLPQLLPFVDEVNIFSALNPAIFGLAVIIFILIEPRGLAHRWEILKIAWKIRPYSY